MKRERLDAHPAGAAPCWERSHGERMWLSRSIRPLENLSLWTWFFVIFWVAAVACNRGGEATRSEGQARAKPWSCAGSERPIPQRPRPSVAERLVAWNADETTSRYHKLGKI